MALKLRPTGLGPGIDKDRPDYTVFTGEWNVGRIYETRGGPDSLRWFWSMTVNGPMTRSDRVAEGVGESGGDDAVGGSSAFVRARKVEAPSAFQGNRSFLGG